MTTEQEKEICVSCGIETEYPKNMPIDLRDCYVEGIGQLCYECYAELIKKGV